MKFRLSISLFAALLLSAALWTTEQAATGLSIAHAQDGFSCANVSEIPQVECEALVAIHTANPRPTFDDWLTTNTPCSWLGITCTEGRVTELDRDVFGGGVSTPAPLPPEIGNLTKLTKLILGFNSILSLPPEIGNLTELTFLDLFDSQLTSLPPEISNLTSLTGLNLADNVLTSLLPEIGNLTALTYLDLGDNQLTTLPPEIGNLSSLQSLRAEYNNLANLPPEVGDLTSLTGLTIYDNQLTNLPAQIGNLVALERLDARNNQLTSLPSEIANLGSLEFLEVSGNPLTSQPVQISTTIQGNGTVTRDIPGPYYVAGTNVQLTAAPDEGWQLQSATCENAVDFLEFEGGVDLTLGEQDANCTITFTMPNDFSCANVSEIPQAECEALVAIHTANPIPSFDDWLTTNTPCNWLGVTCSAAHVTELDRNVFRTGVSLPAPLPPEIGDLTKLTKLILAYNGILSLPPEIGNLTELTVLDLDSNRITSLPPEIGNLTELTYLNLLLNNITSLPPGIGNLTALTYLNLDFNELSSLPPELWTLTSLTSLLIYENNLTSLPPEIGNLVLLEALTLGYSSISSLPPEIGNLASLTILDIRHNLLTSLPAEIGNLMSLERFLLYGNQLTSLPAEIENLFGNTEINLYRYGQSNLPSTIEVNVDGMGDVERDEPGPYYVAGTNVQLTAVPDQGWTLQSATCENAADFVELEDGADLTLGEQNVSCTIVFTQTTSTTCGPLLQEAETGTLSGNWTVGDDASASGGQYIVVPDTDTAVTAATMDAEAEADAVSAAAINRHKASYCFGVTTPGVYRVLGGVYAEDGRDNSFFVQVDGAPTSGYTWDIPRNTRYDADYLNNRDGMDPVEVTLTAGDHVVDIFLREDGARLDKIALILMDETGPVIPPPPPSGCQPLRSEGEDGVLFGNFAVMDDANASGGQYVAQPIPQVRAAGVDALNMNRRHRADYCITVPEGGDYRIRTQVLAPSHRGNSFFVQVDGAPEAGTLYDIFPVSSDPESGTYITDYVQQRGSANPVVVSLTPGDHTISFILRENGARLDSFVLEPVSVQAASVPVPSEIELRANLVAEGAAPEMDNFIFVPLMIR